MSSWQRRFSKELTFGAADTWSKSLIMAAADQDEQNPVNQNLDYRAAPRWLNAVSPLEVERLAARRASLAIDQGGFGMRLEPVDYRSWLGEDDLAQFGA